MEQIAEAILELKQQIFIFCLVQSISLLAIVIVLAVRGRK